jgi:hypothetical protein
LLGKSFIGNISIMDSVCLGKQVHTQSRGKHRRRIEGTQIAAALVALTVGTCGARAAVAAQIDISSQVNANLNTYYNGFVYPPNGGPITIGGIGFNLASYPGGGTGIVQANDGFASTYTFSVGEANVQTVYTVINSAFGEYGFTIGSLTFTGSAGATYTYNLTEGNNVRDHATTFFNTIAPNVYATHDFGEGDRLDVQKIALPSVFGSQILDSITLTATSGGGDPFVAAITTSTATSPVPLPASAPLFGASLLALAGFGYGLSRWVAPKTRDASAT